MGAGITLRPPCTPLYMYSVALFHMDEFEAAKGALEEGARLDPANKQYKTWLRKCQAELDGARRGGGGGALLTHWPTPFGPPSSPIDPHQHSDRPPRQLAHSLHQLDLPWIGWLLLALPSSDCADESPSGPPPEPPPSAAKPAAASSAGPAASQHMEAVAAAATRVSSVAPEPAGSVPAAPAALPEFEGKYR